MKRIMTMTALGLCVLSIAACKSEKADVSEAVRDTGAKVETMAGDNAAKVTGYTKAQYMEACKQSMTEAQCECYVDFYKSLGLEVTELGDSAKVQAAMKDLSAEKAMEMQKCVQ